MTVLTQMTRAAADTEESVDQQAMLASYRLRGGEGFWRDFSRATEVAPLLMFSRAFYYPQLATGSNARQVWAAHAAFLDWVFPDSDQVEEREEPSNSGRGRVLPSRGGHDVGGDDRYRSNPQLFTPETVAAMIESGVAAALAQQGGNGRSRRSERHRESKRSDRRSRAASADSDSDSGSAEDWSASRSRQGLVLVAKVLGGRGRCATFTEYVQRLRILADCNEIELLLIAQVLDTMAGDAGGYVCAAKATEGFEILARRMQALILLDRDEGGNGKLHARLAMGEYVSADLPVADRDLRRYRSLASSQQKAEAAAKANGGGGGSGGGGRRH